MTGTPFIPTHTLLAQVPNTTPDGDGEVLFYYRRSDGDTPFAYCDADDLRPIPEADLPVEVRFPLGSRWKGRNTEAIIEIIDHRPTHVGFIGSRWAYPDGNTHYGPIDTSTLTERIR